MSATTSTAAGLVDVQSHLADLWMLSPPDIFRGTLKHRPLPEALRGVILRDRWDELASGAMRSLTAHHQTVADLGRITAATLVVCGAEDMPTFVANAGILGDAVPECRLVSLSGAGHLCLLERPVDAAAVIGDHLR